MSNGSITELVARGIYEDITTTHNPNKTLFKKELDIRTKYSKTDNRFYTEGNANWSNTFRFKIDRMGDLLYGLYIVVKLPKLSISNLNVPILQDENDPSSIYRIKYSDFIGNVMIEWVKLYINGQLIDEQTGDYLQFYTDLYYSDINRKEMLGLDDYLNQPNLKFEEETIYIPLRYWFCNEQSNPLPVIALQNSDIYIDVKFKKFKDCHSVFEYGQTEVLGVNQLYHSNYIHKEVPIGEVWLQAHWYLLDLEERKQVAQKDHEILITQCQYRTITFKNIGNIDLTFNHTIKDMYFFLQEERNRRYGEYFNFTARMDYPPAELNGLLNKDLWDLSPRRHYLSRARLLFNGSERIEWRDAKYFYNLQNYENYGNRIMTYIYMYSFNSEPTYFNNLTGCNFSRLDKVQLQVESQTPNIRLASSTPIFYPTDNTYTLKCYATNWNFLVIKNGLASLRFSN